MKLLKTRDIRMVLYSIIRQLGEDEQLCAKVMSDDEDVRIKYLMCVDPNYSIAIVNLVSYLRLKLKEKKQVIIFMPSNLSFKIWKGAKGFYYVDNYDIMINYIIYEMLNQVYNEKMQIENGNIIFASPDIPEISEKVPEISDKIMESLKKGKDEVMFRTSFYEFKFSQEERIVKSK